MSREVLVFPIFLKLTGRPVVLVGGGKVAASKLDGLLRVGARVTVVAPQIRAEIERPDVTLRRRGFEASDLDGAWFAVAAATPAVNRRVASAAEERRVFVNAVDDPPSASAYAGGVLRRGGLTVAISTNGEAPALAGLIREGLEELIPGEMETWLREASEQTGLLRQNGIPMPERRPLLLAALNRLYLRRGVDPSNGESEIGETPR
jgi:uroporphyrin-III C-methyltransferase/precorrin-2 dehydrogenase/sirohydrochlorin ferrochelatase